MAVSVPGKALGAAIKALEGRLTDEAYEQVAAFHQGVVKFLQQSSRGEVEGGLALTVEAVHTQSSLQAEAHRVQVTASYCLRSGGDIRTVTGLEY